MKTSLLAMILISGLGTGARAAAWTTLNSTHGGFPEPNAVYYRMAMNRSRLQPGTQIKLNITCPLARYFSVDVYDKQSGASLAFATDRAITGRTDPAQSASNPGQAYDLRLVSEASPEESREGRRELVVPRLAQGEGSIEIWFRVFLGENVQPPDVSLVGPDGSDAGPLTQIPVHDFPTQMSIWRAIMNRSTLPPAPRGDKMFFVPSYGSWIFPNGYAYLVARLDDAVHSYTPGRFSTRPMADFLRRMRGRKETEQFAVMRFKAPTTPNRTAEGQAPQVRYWSVCTVDAPSTTLLQNADGSGACINDQNARVASDGTVTILLGSPRAVAYARESGINVLPVYYPKRLVAMPLVLMRLIPNDPDFRGRIPTATHWRPGLQMTQEDLTEAMGEYAPEGRFFPIRSLQAVVGAAARSLADVGEETDAPRASLLPRRDLWFNAEDVRF